MDEHAKIVVVGGGGTFGASTALELARRGYDDVTAMDVYPCPSEWSAGNDLNKIVRTEYEDAFYSDLAAQAVVAWKTDPLYREHFHETGWVVSSSRGPAKMDKWKLRSAWTTTTTALTSDELRTRFPQMDFLQADMSSWCGLFNADNGWVAAKDALRATGQEAIRLGTRYVTGPAGHVVSMRSTAKGHVQLETQDGGVRIADHVVVCVGAWIDQLVDMQGQTTAKCWTVGHLQLTPEECAALRGLPVWVDAELGFFFEPSSDGKLKFCNEFAGYTNQMPSPWQGGQTVSIPPQSGNYAIPDEAREQLETMRRKMFPRFLNRPIQDERICWCADTSDRSWIIDAHPTLPNVLLATGDSGMAFKFLPTIGKYIVEALEGRLNGTQKEKWKWRPEDDSMIKMQATIDHSRGGGQVKDLASLEGWPHTGV